MSMIDAIPLLAGADGGYQISRSVRLRSSATAYFNRTLTTPTSQNIWSFSCWVKRGSLAKSQFLLWAGTLSTNDCALYFSSSDQIGWFTNNGSSVLSTSTAVFRDPSAWYHIVAIANSTTMNVYVNNQQVITNAGMTNNTINSAIVHNIGRDGQTAGNEFDGYLTEVNFIDGQALTPSSFGETNSVTGVWQPKRYAGTYGTNGFYLPFSDNASLTRLGFDQRSSATVYANGWRNSFNGSASLTAATNAAFAIGTNNFTIEAWIKPTSQAGQIIFVASNGIQVGYQNTTTWGLCQANVAWQLTTTTVPTLNAWNHIVVVRSGTGTNQTAIFLNGTRVAQGTISTSYAQNSCVVGSGIIGDLTNVRLVNGTAIYDPTQTTLTVPTAPLSNVANTAILTCQNETFVDNSSNAFSLTNSATTSARDSAFNTCNDWTPSAGISITAGATYDSMIDVPTLYADGGNGRGNYAVWNPLSVVSPTTLADGNLGVVTGTTGGGGAFSTITIPTSGKYYFEFIATAVSATLSDNARIGLATASVANYVLYKSDGNKVVDGTTSAYGSSFALNDVIGCAIDVDGGTVTFYKNNVSQGSITYSTSNGNYFAYTQDGSGTVSVTANINFGQRPFTYTPPSGYSALNTQNLPTPTISNGAQYMAATTYTGTSANQSISNAVNGVSFQPDFVWMKKRSAAESHILQNSISGVTKFLISNSTAVEDTSSAIIQSFDSGGFTAGTSSTINGASTTYVAWQWNAGGTSTNITVGQYGTSPNVPSIASTVRANATAGFSIVTYTGTGVAATIGHGLGVAPSMIITKPRNLATDWGVYHSGINDPSKALILDSTAAAAAYGGATGMWNNTAPTSTVFSVGNNGSTGGAYNYVAYCFAAVAGYSAFGSYTGNNSTDGPFVYLGFRPRFIMIKSTSVGTEWVMIDTARSSYNLSETSLYANRDYSESTIGTVNDVDILSNGFKLRNNTGFVNASQTYIYAAFSEVGFKYALGR